MQPPTLIEFYTAQILALTYGMAASNAFIVQLAQERRNQGAMLLGTLQELNESVNRVNENLAEIKIILAKGDPNADR